MGVGGYASSNGCHIRWPAAVGKKAGGGGGGGLCTILAESTGRLILSRGDVARRFPYLLAGGGIGGGGVILEHACGVES